MRALSLALKYAKGLFIAAKELNKVEEVGKELKELISQLKENLQVLEFLQSPIYPPEIKIEILQEVLRYFKVSPELEKFLVLLVERRRIQYIEEIYLMYQALLDEEMGMARGEVISSYPLSEEEKRELEQALEELLKKKVVLDVKLDSEILGGVKVRVGDYVIDGTLKSQLSHFKEIIIKGV